MSAGNAQGQVTTYTWNDTDTSFEASGSWSPSGPVWTSNSRLGDAFALFDSQTSIANQPMIGSAPVYANGISFNSSGGVDGQWTLGSGVGGSLSLGVGGLTVLGSSGTTTIEAGIVVVDNQTWSVASGANLMFNGALTLNFGTLTLGSSGSLGSGTGTINFEGGTLQFAGDTTDYSGRFNTSSGALYYSIDVVTGQTVTFASDLNGSGGTLIKSGAGTLVLSGTNDFSGGGVTLNGGVLALESPGALGDSGSIIFYGGTLRYSENNTTDYSARFATSGQDYRIDTNGQTVTFSTGLLLDEQPSTLTKLGAGTLILEAANTYQGNTTIKAGTLSLGTTGSISGSPQITICAGASFDVSGLSGGYSLDSQTLRGSGTVIGSLTVHDTITPGIDVNKIGTLTIQSTAASPGSTAVHVAINGTYNFNIATTLPGSSSFITDGSSSASQTATTGNNHLLIVGSSGSTVDFNGANIKLTSGPDFVFDPEKSYSWKLATVPSGVIVTGLNLSPLNFNVDNFADPLLDTSLLSLAQDGNFIVLNYSPVPEPAAVLGIAVGALAVGGFVRRRIRKPTA
jgi:fibronectin-binding autotransporter adhesin